MAEHESAAEVFASWYERRRAGADEGEDELCAAHPDIADQLRVHLRALALADEALAVRERPPLVPEQVGPYRVVMEVGSGGMGTVYLAEDAAGAPVALKVLHAHLLHRDGILQRFLREAALGRRVVHDNVVRTIDVGSTTVEGQTVHYLALEYVGGQTLRGLLDEFERIPEELCRHIAREVARALVAIHAAGVVHRDLKPDNILLTADHRVKVTDLGIAYLNEAGLRLSRTGMFVGSLAYAAPEQFRGDGKIDGRADLHALGVTLYELAAGRHPFGDGEPRTAMRRILSEPPRRLGEVNPQVSPFFEEVVHTLLAKTPEGRFASAAELLTVLESAEDGAWWRDRSRAMGAAQGGPHRRARVPAESAVHGRDEELARVRAVFGRAAAGEGQVVLVEGEAGIGKSRLVDEVVARLGAEGEQFDFLCGSFPPGGAATARTAFAEAFRERFGAGGAAGRLARSPSLVPAFDALLRDDRPPPGAAELTRDAVHDCFVQAMRSVAAERPTIVAIEDLHFAPEEGRALFAALSLAVEGHRVLLIGTARPGLPVSWVSGLGRAGNLTRIPLGRLGAADVALLLRDSLGSEKLAADLAPQVAARSDGNPYFAFEILRDLRDAGALRRTPEGNWETPARIAEIRTPASVVGLILARVAELGPDERDLLDAAACCGFEFDATLVADALDVGRIPALRGFARIEQEHRLVHAAADRFVFDHHLVQETLAAALPPPLAAEYHGALGAALERRAGDAVKDPARMPGRTVVALADHFVRGPDPRRALPYLDAALTHLGRSFRNEPMVELIDRALAVPGLVADAERARLLRQRSLRTEPAGRPAG
jgi:hypothetical protein